MPWAVDPNLIQSLISSSCWIVGELATNDLRLQIAFPTHQLHRLERRNVFDRGHFLLTLKIPDDPTQGFVVPSMTFNGRTTYAWQVVGERLTDLAAIWYGKRFDYHGIVAQGDIAELPDLSTISPVTSSDLEPYNSSPRSDIAIELNLTQLQPVMKLLSCREPKERLNAFWTATRFYATALRMVEADPEIAFFHFVVALETISSQIDVPYNELYDDQTRQDLEDIRRQISPEAAKRIEKRLFQVRRRVVYTVKSLLNQTFFNGGRAEGIFKLTPERIEGCMKAVYDLRSKYAHGGTAFGNWFMLQVGGPTAEVNLGRPVLPGNQRELEKLLKSIPTFVGLERTVRFVILSFAHRYIEPIHIGLQKEVEPQ